MATIKIETLQFKTRDGQAVYVTGIDPVDIHAIVGHVHFPSGEQIPVDWDIKGHARDKEDSFKIDRGSMESNEFFRLRKAVLALVSNEIRQQMGYS